MPHTYNIRAFKNAALGISNPLLRLYCSLVELELAIKDHLQQQPSGSWKNGHRVTVWLTDLGESSLSTQLSTQLSVLYCTNKNGDEANVQATQYPDLRYLRHETDFPFKSTDAQLNDALSIVRDIKIRLRGRGLNL